jgi:hypothetical protein
MDDQQILIHILSKNDKVKLLYPFDEAKELLGCGINQVTQLVETGELGVYQSPLNTRKKAVPIFEIFEHIKNNTRKRKL